MCNGRLFRRASRLSLGGLRGSEKVVETSLHLAISVRHGLSLASAHLDGVGPAVSGRGNRSGCGPC